MKKLITLVALISVVNAQAITLLSHKSNTSNIVKIADSEVSRVWASNSPACLKDGSRLMGVNKAFVEKKLKYADCSSSENAREKQRMLGYTVTVIKFTELSDSLAKQVTGQKI